MIEFSCENDEEISKLNSRAGELFCARGMYSRALSYFDDWQSDWRHNVDTLKGRILLYLCCNEIFSALNEIGLALSFHPKDPWIRLYRGACFIAEHKTEQARKQFELAERLDPTQKDSFRQIQQDWADYIQRSGFDAKKEKVKDSFFGICSLVFSSATFDAVKSLDHSPVVAERLAILSNPESPIKNPSNAKKELAIVLWQITGKELRSCSSISANSVPIESLNEALSYDPNNVDILKDRVFFYIILKRTDLALKDIETGLKIDRNHGLMHARKAMLMQYLGRSHEAAEICQNAIALSPNYEEQIVRSREMMQKNLDMNGMMSNVSENIAELVNYALLAAQPFHFVLA